MKLFNISLKMFVFIFLIFSLVLAGYKANLSYSFGGLLPFGSSTTHTSEELNENILVNKSLDSVNFNAELQKILALTNSSLPDMNINGVSLYVSSSEKPVIGHFRIQHFEKSYKYFQRKSINVDSYADKIPGKQITQISSSKFGEFVRIPKLEMYQGDTPLAILSTLFDMKFRGYGEEEINDINIDVVDYISSGTDFATLTYYKNKTYGAKYENVAFLQYANNSLSKIDDVKNFKTNKPCKILKMNIGRVSSDHGLNTSYIIVNGGD